MTIIKTGICRGSIGISEKGKGPFSDIATITAAGDILAPMPPSDLTAFSVAEGICLTWKNPTTNADGSPLTDLAWIRIYHATAPGIDPANPATYTGTHDLMAETWTDELSGNETRFYLLTAIDRSKNESITSAEVTATSDILAATAAVDDHADNVDSIFVGKTRIFVKVRSPKPTWSRFSHYNIYFDVDAGTGWSGAWTHLSETRIGFMHRGLNETHKYKYRVTVESEDGVTTTGTISDNAGAGYQPNALNQNTILADTVAAQNMIAQYDMLAQTFVGGVLQSVNWGGTAGTQFDLDGGTFQIGGSTAPKLSWDGTTLSVVGAITIQSGSGIANLTDAGALAVKNNVDLATADVLNKTADNIAETAARKWAGQTGADVTNYLDPRIANALSEHNVLTIQRPLGATFSGGANATGAIVVRLPRGWTNTMMRFAVEVYDYVTGRSFELHLGGYNHTTGWIHETANLVGSTAADNRVRFGHDGTRCCIVIGETTSVWQHPKIHVSNFQAGHSNFALDQWNDDWSISLVTNLTGYTFTADFPDALIDAATIRNQGALATRNTIASTHIDANAVTTPKIAANAITADKINVSTLSAITANMGVLTAGTIRVPNTGWRIEITDGIIPFRYWNGAATKFQLDNAGNISLNDGMITGSLFRTAASGVRTILGEPLVAGEHHPLAFYDAAHLRALISGKGINLYRPMDGAWVLTIGGGGDIATHLGFRTIPGNILFEKGGTLGGFGTNDLELTDEVRGCFKFSNARVFDSAAAPTTWTALNLSTWVGARRALVLLGVQNLGDDTNYRFRRRGGTVEQHSWANEFPGAFSTRVDTIERYNWVWCITDTAGRIEWDADRASTTTLDLIAYIT